MPGGGVWGEEAVDGCLEEVEVLDEEFEEDEGGDGVEEGVVPGFVRDEGLDGGGELVGLAEG